VTGYKPGQVGVGTRYILCAAPIRAFLNGNVWLTGLMKPESQHAGERGNPGGMSKLWKRRFYGG